ncbi:MAG: LytTR family transcriptional regulator DNA-binding domain-containing protein [Bacteroidales bacterium]|jgi:two-component system LytT family response regulator|nr:LytTR family transcriptional regulator DNA-binding domain-containing protein [Bacteroidales bacterium]
MIKILIVDDEAPARDLIRHYLQAYPEVEVVGEADNGFEAMKLIRELTPDLLFLDVQMPKLTGFEMLELIDNPPDIILSTAFDRYAIRAFEMNAVDYLLKPYSKERFDTAVQKALSRLTAGESPVVLPTLQQISTLPTPETLTRIAVKDRQQIHVVPVNDIDYIEADGDYVKLHTGKNAFLKEKTMKYFEENLPSQFIRIHRSYIVNVNGVSKIELYEKESYRVYLKNGMMLKASSTGYKALKDAVNF